MQLPPLLQSLIPQPPPPPRLLPPPIAQTPITCTRVSYPINLKPLTTTPITIPARRAIRVRMLRIRATDITPLISIAPVRSTSIRFPLQTILTFSSGSRSSSYNNRLPLQSLLNTRVSPRPVALLAGGGCYRFQSLRILQVSSLPHQAVPLRRFLDRETKQRPGFSPPLVPISNPR